MQTQIILVVQGFHKIVEPAHALRDNGLHFRVRSFRRIPHEPVAFEPYLADERLNLLDLLFV
ncbi:MAG: hypothetical protein GTN69_07255 [Armatimonadetes bacterium]|nr:hypothetical protein [Armatimonadota bacterium]